MPPARLPVEQALGQYSLSWAPKLYYSIPPEPRMGSEIGGTIGGTCLRSIS